MIAIRALTDMQQIKKEGIRPRLFSLFSVKGLVIIYVKGGGEGKKMGGQCCFRLARGGGNFFSTINRGGLDFLRFARGLVCAFANGITFMK